MIRQVVLIVLMFCPVQAMQKVVCTKVVCTSESLAVQEMREELRTRFLRATSGAKGKKRSLGEDDMPLWLGGVLYTAIGITVGGSEGREGDVYIIKNEAGELFALKLYKEDKRDRQTGDEVALAKAKESRAFILVPILVNSEYGYTVFPLLKISLRFRSNNVLLRALQQNLRKALYADRLELGDSSPDNYMYDEQGRLWRIDLGTLREVGG